MAKLLGPLPCGAGGHFNEPPMEMYSYNPTASIGFPALRQTSPLPIEQRIGDVGCERSFHEYSAMIANIFLSRCGVLPHSQINRPVESKRGCDNDVATRQQANGSPQSQIREQTHLKRGHTTCHR